MVRIVTVLALLSVGFFMGMWFIRALERQAMAELDRELVRVAQPVRW